MIDLGAIDPTLLSLSIALVLGIVIGIIGFVLGKILSPARDYPRKTERYECGNPPRGRARGLLMMQYYPFLILFLTLEPIMIYSFLFLLEAKAQVWNVFLLFLAMVLILIPPLMFGLHYARRVELWYAR